MSDVDADLELDCRGLRCPLPVIRLANGIGDVPVGGTLALVADDPAAAPDVEAWCRMRGHEYAGQSVTPDGIAVYLVRRVL